MLHAPDCLAHRVAGRTREPSSAGRTIVSLSCEEAVSPGSSRIWRAMAIIFDPLSCSAGRAYQDEVINNVIAMRRAVNIEEVVLFVDPERMSNVQSIARRLPVLPLPVTFVPFGPLAQLLKRSRNDIGDTMALELQRAALSPAEQVVKRGVTSSSRWRCWFVRLRFLAVAAAIKLDSPGPLLFRQNRCGFNGRPFRIYKCNTMENGDVARQERPPNENDTKPAFARRSARANSSTPAGQWRGCGPNRDWRAAVPCPCRGGLVPKRPPFARLCSATIWMGRQRQSGWPFWRSRRRDDCPGGAITQALFRREMV